MRQKTKEKFIWGVLLMTLMTSIILLGRSYSSSVEDFDKKSNPTRLSTNWLVYEVKYKGVTYVVVETHLGVGVCQKASLSFDTNLVATPFNIKTK